VQPSPLEQLSKISKSHLEKSCASAALKKVRSWLCNQERWYPELVNTFGASARYRRATVGSSYDDAHLDNSTLITGKINSFPLHIGKFFLLLLRLRRDAAAKT
jgi:hypothetical protein